MYRKTRGKPNAGDSAEASAIDFDKIHGDVLQYSIAANNSRWNMNCFRIRVE